MAETLAQFAQESKDGLERINSIPGSPPGSIEDISFYVTPDSKFSYGDNGVPHRQNLDSGEIIKLLKPYFLSQVEVEE